MSNKCLFSGMADAASLAPTMPKAEKQPNAPTPAPQAVVMTRAELAKAFRVTPNTITNWVSRGMPCFYIGRLKTCAKGSKPRFVFADCLAWVQRGEF